MEKDLKGDLFKKIIQLTRKLYLINSKSEESNAIIDAIVRSYTSEEKSLNKKYIKEINSLKEKNKEITKNYKENKEKNKTRKKKK